MTFDYRLKPGDLCRNETSPFGQQHVARTTFPLEECIASKSFFMNVRANFQGGDFIHLQRYVNDAWGEAIEVCPFLMVSRVDPDGVVLLQIFPVQKIPGDASEKGISVSRGFRGRFVIRLDGAVIGERNTVVEANEAADQLGAETGKPVSHYNTKKAA